MTKEEFLSKTDIKNESEAFGYLSHLTFLFVTVFGGMIAVRALGQLSDETLSPNLYLIIWFAWILYLVYFVYFCVKVINLTKKVTKASAVWSILFAPISWIWFYPELTKPLKIIIGRLAPPETLPNVEEKKAIADKVNSSFWKSIKIAVLISLGVVVVTIVYVQFQPNNVSNKGEVAGGTKQLIENKEGYPYLSTELNFKVIFPVSPKRTDGPLNVEGLKNVQQTVYTAEDGNVGYYLSVTNYNDSRVSEKNPEYNVDAVLEASVNEMVNSIPNAKLLTNHAGNLTSGEVVVRSVLYKVETQDEFLEGAMAFKDGKLYTIMTEYLKEGEGKEGFKSFFNSFEFIK